MKKIYEKMVVTDGKMQYAVELQSKNEKERPTYVIIRNGKIVFENGYFNSISCYDASDETHEIAKQMRSLPFIKAQMRQADKQE